MSKIHELAFNAEEIDELLDSVDKKTIYQDANQSVHGLMSATDKSKLDALPTAQQIDSALNDKVDKEAGKGLSKNDYTDADKAKVASALQTETDPTVPSWAKQQNKPSYNYSEIGNTPDLSGFITKSVNDLTNYYLKSETYTKAEVAALIGAIQQFHYEIYATLPQSGESNVLYLIGPTGSGSDKYEEYVYANNAFTKIGDTSIDLSGYVTTSALNTALEDYTTTSNLTALLSNKADKVSNATNGNLAGLDANGNLTDSGKKASDFATASQGAKADTAYQKPSSGIPKSDLSSDVQQALQKHFKGWYASPSSLPSNPVVGDYAYVKGAETTAPAAIYECITAGSWSDSGRTADTSNVQTFASGEEVNEVHIVNDLTTGGTEDVASAEMVKDIAELVEINNDYSIVSYEVKKLLYVSSRGVITNAGSTNFYIGYIPSVNIDRKIRIIVSDKSSSTGNYAQPVRGVFFVDDVSEIVAGTTVTYLIVPSTPTQVSLDVEINVPANKVLCVTYFKDGYDKQELATYEDIGNSSSKIKEAVGDISELLGIKFSKGEELQHTVYNNVFLKSNNVITSTSGTGKIYVYAASNEDRKIYVEQYFIEAYNPPFAAVFLIDDVSELVSGTFISYSNILIVPRSNISGIVNDTTISVPAGKILCVTTVEDSRNYCKVCEAILKSNEIESLNTKIGDLQDLETTINTSVVASINEVAESVYANITSPLSPTKILGRRLSNNTTIKSATEGVWNIAYFAARQEEWKANIIANNISSSISVGAVVLVDAVTDLDVDDTVSPIINSHPANQGGTPWSMDVVVKVPAGKILAVFEINYNTSVFNYNEVTGKAAKTDLLEQEQERLADIVSNPDYVSENPLDIIKETAGYTAIFRTMGVIGGSMSSGAHSYNQGTQPIEPSNYAYSSLQFMARLCGAEGFNFSEGGCSAHEWLRNTIIGGASDLFNNNPVQMYLIQLGNNDVGYVNPNASEYDSTYSIGNVSDVAGNNGVYVNTFYGKMGGILNKIRQVQPRAYVFLSTFLKGYGTIPPRYAPDFDYNVAIRNIVNYYTENDGANRPEGDELHYYLIDYYTYGKPWSYYYNGIHTGTERGSHLVATGYLLWAYQYCTYIDWIIKNNMSDFNDVAFVGSDRYYN